MKHKLAIWFLFLAQIMMLGHNFIPHHHQDPFESPFLKSHHCSQHHHDNAHGILETVFSLVPHSEKGMEVMTCVHFERPVKKHTFTISGILTEEFKIKRKLLLDEESLTLYKAHFDPLFKLLPSGLRAPPFFS